MRDDAGAANPSYKGYDYQKLVTVWVALRLMFGSDACTDQIVVEPASQDDVKARLAVVADHADVDLTIDAADELHVQIKFKGAGFWSAQEFAAVVEDKAATGTRGPKPRVRAKSLLLADRTRRYVFITNTSVDAVLAKGRVKSPEVRADAAFVPTHLQVDAVQKESLAGRFALIETMTMEESRRQIDQMLTTALNVPPRNLDACVDRLKRLVEDRFLDVPDPMRRSDVRKIAEGFGGAPHPNPDLARYVPPSTRARAEELLSARGAVLLVGPTGYGKSLTAESLVDERRRGGASFEVVRETAGLHAVEEAFAASGPTLFHLDDPWGQSALRRDEAAQWTNRLSAFMRRAVPGKQFVITSRSEIHHEALGYSPAPLWADRTVTIDDDAYDLAARRKILHGNLAAAGGWRLDLAVQHERNLLRELRSPLELNAFARELVAVDKPSEADVAKLVDRAQTNSRKHVVMDQVRAFGDPGVRGATVLWALLRLSRSLDPERLIRLRREVGRTEGVEIALDDLARHLAQTQLTYDGEGAYAAHGKVVEALESLAHLHPRAAETALNAVARAAIALTRKEAGWLEELHRFVEGAHELAAAPVMLDDDVVEAFEEFLIATLIEAGDKASRFRSAWRAASRQLGTKTPIGMLVRWLGRGARREKGWVDFGWAPPETTPEDRNAVIAADPTFRILKGFVAHVLPWSPQNYDADDLLPWLEPFGADLADAFLAGGEEVVRARQFVMSADAISEGALTGSNPAYHRVWDQILELDAVVQALLAEAREELRQAWQGEMDFADGLAVQERYAEDGPSVGHFAQGYVSARRRHQGHEWIPSHPRPEIVLPAWVETMLASSSEVSATELDTFFAAAGDDGRLQALGLKLIGQRRLRFGLDRVFAALTTGGPDLVGSAVRALNELEREEVGSPGGSPAERLLLDMMPRLPPIRAAILAPEIVRLVTRRGRLSLAQKVLAAAAPGARALVHLVLGQSLRADDDAMLRQFRTLEPAQAHALITDGPRALARLLLVMSAVEGADVVALARQWANSDDERDARAAIAALAHIGAPAADAAISGALSHAHFEVRRAALLALAPRASSGRRRRIFELASDRSAPVREALAETIGDLAWIDGLDILASLLGDRRNYARHPERQPRREPEHRVARTAAASLDRFDPLPASVLDGVAAILGGNGRRVDDVVLHAMLIGLLAKYDHPTVWSVLECGLADDHVVGLAGENLYPIRYAAAWAVVGRLERDPPEIDLAPWSAIKAAADHFDPQLAAPALMALGVQMAIACDAGALQSLRGQNATDARVLLALSMFDDLEAARVLARNHGLLSEGHPFLDDGPDPTATEGSADRWTLSAKTGDWLASLHGEADVEAVLLWAMRRRTGMRLGEEDFDPTELRRGDAVPITTLAEMLGME